MQISHEPYRTRYIELIAPMITSLEDTSFGRVVIYKLMKNFPEIIKYSICGNSSFKYTTERGNGNIEIQSSTDVNK